MKADKILQRVVIDKYVVFYKGNTYTKQLKNPTQLHGFLIDADTPISEVKENLEQFLADHKKVFDTISNACLVATMDTKVLTFSINLL